MSLKANTGLQTCHVAAGESDRYTVVAENFRANSPVYALIYSLSSESRPDGSTEAKLFYRTTLFTDETGVSRGELSADFVPGSIYFVLGVPEGVTAVTRNDVLENDLFFEAIANAIDCFIVPTKESNAVMVGSTPIPTETPLASSVIVSARPTSYTLQAGEFIYCIARRFNVDPTELLALNGLVRSQILYSGHILKIPQGGKPFLGKRSLQSHPTTYTVISSRQTLGSVACLFGDVDPAAIARHSGISPTTPLFVGQQLNIP